MLTRVVGKTYREGIVRKCWVRGKKKGAYITAKRDLEHVGSEEGRWVGRPEGKKADTPLAN